MNGAQYGAPSYLAEDAFSHCIGLADVLQALHAHAGDLQGDAAGLARHEDGGAPQQAAAILGGGVVNASVLRDQARRQVVIGVRCGPRFSYPEARPADTMP